MSDRTTVTLTVHACPPHQVAAVLAVIEQHTLDDCAPVLSGRLFLDDSYQDYEGGGAEDIHAQLVEGAPDAAWTVYEAPSGECLGTVHRHFPGLGSWSAACDGDGDGVFTAAHIWQAIADETLPALLGHAWEEAIGALTDDDEVCEPTRLDVEYDTRTGEGVIVGPDDPEDVEFRLPPGVAGVTVGDRLDAHLLDLGYRRVPTEDWSAYGHRGRHLTTEVYRIDTGAGAAS